MTQRAVQIWVVLAIAATILTGAGYVVAQQAVRHAADHPQIEMARAAASKLNAGASPASVLPAGTVDIAQSSDAYVIVVDASGKVLAASASLGGATVVPPAGVFDYGRSHGEDTVTWQPAAGARSAIVVDAYNGGFVVAGRSLRETEDLESRLILWAGGAWAAVVVLIGVAVTIRFRA